MVEPSTDWLVVSVFIVAGVIYLWALGDAVARPPASWKVIRSSQLFWIALLIVLPLAAPLYLLAVRPRLRAQGRLG